MREERPSTPPSAFKLGALFGGFFTIGISGFGGVLPWARQMLVQDRRWLTEREFIETLSLCQLLPGPNIVNVAVCVGMRFRGAAGAVAAVSGLMLAPFAIVLLLASFYGRYIDVPAVHGALRGVASAVAGMMVATGLKMAAGYRRDGRAAVFIVTTFVAIALLRYPLPWVVLGLGALGIAFVRRPS